MSQTTRVLCVDDSADTRDLLRDLLEAEGYEVAEADSATAGLRQLRSQRFDVLVTDHMMPDQTGAWLLGQAEQHGLLRSVGAVVITANHRPELLGYPPAVPIFQKPFNVDLFLRKVEALAAESRARARER